jgi:hypothetical protein
MPGSVEDPSRSSLLLSRRTKGTAMKKIDITKLPELATKVGIHGSAKQREVGGTGCGGIVLAIVTG